MSQYSESYTPRTGEFAPETSATDVARDQAADVAQHARHAGGQVTQTATDQAEQVAAETSRQVRDLLGEAQGQARDQAAAQQQKAAQQLRSAADELGQMAERGGQNGVATEFARQAAGRLASAAAWLEKREPADLLDEARNFARRRPGAFLIGAAVAGLAAGRLTRGLTAGSNGAGDNGQLGGSGGAHNGISTATASGTGEYDGADFPAATDRIDPLAPVYPAGPVDPAGGGSAAGTAPIDRYPTEPVYPPEPGITPGTGEAG